MPRKPQSSPTHVSASRAGAALGLAMALSACSSPAPLDWARAAAQQADFFAASLFAGPGPQTRRLVVSPAPATRPARPLTRAIAAVDLRTGATITLQPRAIGARTVEVRQSDGCVWRRDDWFAPSSRWRGCGDSASWRDGSAEVSGGDGLWPLRIGAEGRFRRRATSATGRTLARDTICRVDSAVEVLRADQPATPAFVVACDDGKRVRTTWWAPGEGPIAFRKTHRDKGVEAVWVAE